MEQKGKKHKCKKNFKNNIKAHKKSSSQQNQYKTKKSSQTQFKYLKKISLRNLKN